MTPTPAHPSDLSAVAALLAACALPSVDVTESHLPHFFACKDGDGQLAGIVGLEPYGDAGLVRSLAVVPAARGRGLGGQLVDALEAHAYGQGLRTLYLLTTTAEPFFARRGYAPVDRGRVPEAIRSTAEFTALCPASAVCMMKELAPARADNR